jgi:hypothetical protein
VEYIISGIAPGFGGVARFVEFLENNLESKKYIFLYPEKNIQNFRNILKTIKNQNVTIIHPQSVGLKETIQLIDNNNVNLYVVDNSFFCLKSYNHLSGENTECLACLEDLSESIKNQCDPFPVRYASLENIVYLKKLYELAPRITFFVLSKSSKNLVERYFGKHVRTKKVSFLSEELFASPTPNAGYVKQYDIVYHGSTHAAKGIEYVQKISQKLPQYSFFFPCNKDALGVKTKNIDSRYVVWEDGLREIVENAKLVLTPSLWSYMPETATLKSFLHNGSVGLINNKYGFGNDVSNGAYLNLSGNIAQDAKLISEYIDNKEFSILKKSAKGYVRHYMEQAYEELSAEFTFKDSLQEMLRRNGVKSVSGNEQKLDFSKNYNRLFLAIKDLEYEKNKFIIYGHGTVGKTIQALIPDSIIAFVDQKSTLISQDIQKGEVYSPANISNMSFDKIIISVLGREEEIECYLTQTLHVNKEKITRLSL